MTKYRVYFSETTIGYVEVEAATEQEAEKMVEAEGFSLPHTNTKDREVIIAETELA